jgi:unconventional prefoldin RPB5 interactor 1
MAASVKKGMQTVGVDPNMRGNPTGGMDGFDLSSISKDISTTISSVTGGGSTTTKQVQTDESKAAEKELKSVKEQYAAERESLLQKVKEKLGPDAKSRSIRTEMREGDEGKALEEKYKALIGPLEKQIESGIKWEVETKQAAAKETKTAIASELLIKEDQAAALERINENRKKINEGETKSIAEQLSVYKQSNEAKTEEEKNTAAALERINENRKKINTDEIAASTASVPIIKQDQLNKPIENPLLNDKGKISLNKLNLPGMPNFGKSLAPKDPKPADPKGAAASISEEAKRADAKKAEEKKKAEDAKKAEAAKGTTAAKPTGSVQQTASLNDVVKSLDQLNMQMGKLISQQSDLIRKQTSSMLAAGSNNVYDKTR